MTPGRLVESMGTITAAGIRATEQLWIPYRDAWAKVGTGVRPDIPADVWKAWLTAERTDMLSRLLSP